MLLPDVIITNSLNMALSIVRDDYNSYVEAGHEERSMLYLLFNSSSIGRYDMYENAKSIIITTPESPKHLSVVVGYQAEHGKIPQIFVTLPSENEKNNSIGIGVEDDNNLFFAGEEEDEADQYREQFSRRFNTTYHVVVMTENRNEMIILYNLMKALVITLIEHFAESGISNLHLGGQDINLMAPVPDKIFRRAVTMTFEYEQLIPIIDFKDVVRDIRLYWKLEDAEERQGPIEFGTNDDLSEDSDSDS